jgi:plasmid maintenance system antidote protein VapI
MTRTPHALQAEGVLADAALRKNGRFTVSEFARRFGASCAALSLLVSGRAAVGAKLAIRLAAALGAVPIPASMRKWLNDSVKAS